MINILKYYKETLEIDLSDLSHPISSKINSIQSSSEIDQKIKEHHLRTLGLSLMDIKGFDETIYQFYLKRIIKNSDISIHGHIFEINQCAHFIRTSSENKLQFKFGDANQNEPDFIIEKIGFEITSIRFSENSNKSNPARKLLKKFIAKNKKEYANENTVLIIDINQPSYYTIKNGKRIAPTLNEIREIIRTESKFGLVLYFMELIDNVDDNLFFKGITYWDYSKKCTIELRCLMEKHFFKENKTSNGKVLVSPN